MWHDGIDYHYAPNLQHRKANVRDRGLNGEIFEPGTTVFVYAKECGRLILDTKDPYEVTYFTTYAPIFPQSRFGSPLRCIGQVRKSRSKRPRLIEGHMVKEYYVTPVYLAYNKKVYVGHLYSLKPKSLNKLKKTTNLKILNTHT